MNKPTLVIMAKLPKAGSVKTRLARDIGTTAATFFYRHTMRNLVQRLGTDKRWHTVIAVSPDTETLSPVWPSHVARLGQGRGDLGHRMQRVFNVLPPGPVIIIGTDIPEISASLIANAFRTLSHHNAVIGPSEDGGYWLIGQKRTPKPLDIFRNVRWSSEQTRADTLANLKGHSVAQLQWLNDVDNGTDHHRLKTIAARVILPVTIRA